MAMTILASFGMGIVQSRSSAPLKADAGRFFRYATALAMRSLRSAMVVSSLANVAGFWAESRAALSQALSQASCTCCASVNMSGARRALTRSSLADFACAAPLSRIADRLSSIGTKVSTLMVCIEMFIVLSESPALAPGGQGGGIEIFVEPGDAAFAYLADDAGCERDLLAVGELALQKMLLDEAAFEDVEPAPRVVTFRDAANEALQRLEILIGRDRRAIIVVPDDRIRRVDVAHRLEITALDRVEETLRQLARRFVGHARLLQPPARALVITISSPGSILCRSAS